MLKILIFLKLKIKKYFTYMCRIKCGDVSMYNISEKYTQTLLKIILLVILFKTMYKIVERM